MGDRINNILQEKWYEEESSNLYKAQMTDIYTMVDGKYKQNNKKAYE